MVFDSLSFLRVNFDSPKGVIKALKDNALPSPSEGAARHWFVRGSIPGMWVALLVFMLERSDKGFRMGDFINMGQADDNRTNH